MYTFVVFTVTDLVRWHIRRDRNKRTRQTGRAAGRLAANILAVFAATHENKKLSLFSPLPPPFLLLTTVPFLRPQMAFHPAHALSFAIKTAMCVTIIFSPEIRYGRRHPVRVVIDRLHALSTDQTIFHNRHLRDTTAHVFDENSTTIRIHKRIDLNPRVNHRRAHMRTHNALSVSSFVCIRPGHYSGQFE